MCCDRVHVSSHFQLCDSAMIFWPSLFTVTKGKSSMMWLFQEYIRCVRYPVSWSKISLWSLNLVVTCINFTCILKYTWTSFGYPPPPQKKYDVKCTWYVFHLTGCCLRNIYVKLTWVHLLYHIINIMVRFIWSSFGGILFHLQMCE